MRKLIGLLIMIIAGSAFATADNWQKRYMEDEFGDSDYSKPMFVSSLSPRGSYGATVTFIFVNGTFGVQFTDKHELLKDIRSLKIKSQSGNIYEIGFEDRGEAIAIDDDYAPMFLALIDEGCFSMSIKTAKSRYSSEVDNHAFKFDNQTKGIRDLLEHEGWLFPLMNGDL